MCVMIVCVFVCVCVCVRVVPSRLQPTNYVWILHNATAVCRALVPPECIAKLGPAACMLMTVRNSSVLATVLEPPANVTDGTIIRMASEGGTGDGGSNHTLAIVLGCVLGGRRRRDHALAYTVSTPAAFPHRRRL